MKTKQVKIETLLNDPANVRKHDQRNIDAIKASLQKFGQQKPIVVDKNGIVVAGNGTLAAAKDLGWNEIAVVETELEGAAATAFAIADNRTAELAAWDDEALTATFRELEGNGFSLEDLGFDKKKLDEYLNASEKKTYDEMFVPEFLVLVTCANESDQAEVFDKCQKLGFDAKLVS